VHVVRGKLVRNSYRFPARERYSTYAMEEEFVLEVHHALHNWADVEGEVEMGDGQTVTFGTNKNGCRFATYMGHNFMEQNKDKPTKWGKMVSTIVRFNNN